MERLVVSGVEVTPKWPKCKAHKDQDEEREGMAGNRVELQGSTVRTAELESR